MAASLLSQAGWLGSEIVPPAGSAAGNRGEMMATRWDAGTRRDLDLSNTSRLEKLSTLLIPTEQKRSYVSTGEDAPRNEQRAGQSKSLAWSGVPSPASRLGRRPSLSPAVHPPLLQLEACGRSP